MQAMIPCGCPALLAEWTWHAAKASQRFANAKQGNDMKLIAVIGAGQMGSGIAQTAAQSGFEVLLADVDVALAEKARDKIGKTLARLAEKEKITAADAQAAVDRIQPVEGYASMAGADLIIEAATEREDIKHRIFEAAGKVLRGDAILASNTSSIPITRSRH